MGFSKVDAFLPNKIYYHGCLKSFLQITKWKGPEVLIMLTCRIYMFKFYIVVADFRFIILYNGKIVLASSKFLCRSFSTVLSLISFINKLICSLMGIIGDLLRGSPFQRPKRTFQGWMAHCCNNP